MQYFFKSQNYQNNKKKTTIIARKLGINIFYLKIYFSTYFFY
jgi:hypothetical protein